MNQYSPNKRYVTNTYIDKMFCHYCNKCSRNKDLCEHCGKTIFGQNSINAYTPKIPPRVDFSYVNSLLPNKYPYIYYYGSYQGKIINY